MANLKNKKKEILSNALGNIKLQDAGVKRKKMSDACCISSSNNKVNYPHLYLNVKEAPQLKGYEVGDKVIFVAEAEVVSHSKNDDMNSSRESFELKIKKIGCKEKNSKDKKY